MGAPFPLDRAVSCEARSVDDDDARDVDPKILAATLIPVVLAEGPFGPQGRFFGGFRGPLAAAAATPGIYSVEPVYVRINYGTGFLSVAG
ncbi:hypothetical protein MRX96_036165 [Rhipicephalus microplus]